MNKLSFAGCIIGMQLLLIFHSSAQTRTNANTLQPPKANLKIDGSLKDWGDSLRYYTPDRKINYALANNKDYLYVAIKLNDRLDQIRFLNAGLTLAITTKGKKSGTYTMTFPATDPNATSHSSLLLIHKADGSVITGEDRDDLMSAKLTKLRNIKLTGFKDIEEDMITTTNTYGFKADMDYDNAGSLIYEAAIPLKLLGDYQANKDAWTFNFKLNGIKFTENSDKSGANEGEGMRGGGGGGRRGGSMGGGGRRGGGMGGNMGGGRTGGGEGESHNAELNKATDFSEKYYLAN